MPEKIAVVEGTVAKTFVSKTVYMVLYRYKDKPEWITTGRIFDNAEKHMELIKDWNDVHAFIVKVKVPRELL